MPAILPKLGATGQARHEALIRWACATMGTHPHGFIGSVLCTLLLSSCFPGLRRFTGHLSPPLAGSHLSPPLAASQLSSGASRSSVPLAYNARASITLATA